MKKLLYLLFSIALITACNSKNSSSTEPEPTPDPIPEEQEIVYLDTSGLTGKLTVTAKYYDINNQINNAPEGTSVSLYASYDDMQNGLSLYNVFTTADTAYFGFINYGNYYVTSNTSIDTLFYYGEAAVQVRPDRKEDLTITMY